VRRSMPGYAGTTDVPRHTATLRVCHEEEALDP